MTQLRTLRAHVRVAALTNNWSFARRLLEARGIALDFDPIVNSAEEGLRKPDQRIYRIALERLRVAADETVFRNWALCSTKTRNSLVSLHTACRLLAARSGVRC